MPKIDYDGIADRMVRDQLSLRAACAEAGIIDLAGVERLERSKAFQQAKWNARNRYYAEIADTPGLGKQVLVGQALVAINQLVESGEWDKALEGILKLAKIMGIVGSENGPNVFGLLTDKEFREIRKRLDEQSRSGD